MPLSIRLQQLLRPLLILNQNNQFDSRHQIHVYFNCASHWYWTQACLKSKVGWLSTHSCKANGAVNYYKCEFQWNNKQLIYSQQCDINVNRNSGKLALKKVYFLITKIKYCLTLYHPKSAKMKMTWSWHIERYANRLRCQWVSVTITKPDLQPTGISLL